MTAIIKDFDEVWLHPTPSGMAYSKGGDEQVTSVYLRVYIEATAREDWHIDEVHMVSFDYEYDRHKDEMRTKEYIDVLEGDFLEQTKDFLYGVYESDFQDAVDLEILSTGELVEA